MFLSLTCCSVWLFVSLFVGCCVGDSDSSAALIKQRSHIKSMFVSMLHQTLNLKYSRHIRIICCVGLEPFLLAINLDVVSSSNVFSNLIYVFRCEGITILNQ